MKTHTCKSHMQSAGIKSAAMLPEKDALNYVKYNKFYSKPSGRKELLTTVNYFSILVWFKGTFILKALLCSCDRFVSEGRTYRASSSAHY